MGGAFPQYAFAATGAPTPRTMPDRLAEVVNVKDFGAIGNGIADDRAALQAAIDAAFGPAGSPNGTNAHLNRPLFFPNGIYKVNAPLVLTRVRGARIYASGQATTTIIGASGAIVTNGCEDCCFENILFAAGSSQVAFELDWDGVGSVGLGRNTFTNCGFGGSGSTPTYACRIGFSGNGGANNQFYGCNFASATNGLVAWGAAAIGNSVQGGGASGNATAFWAKDGQIASINDVGMGVNSAQDILLDSVFPILAKGNRTESVVFFKATNANNSAKLDGNSMSWLSGNHDFCRTKGKAILDSCTTNHVNMFLTTDNTYAGTVYLRGCQMFPYNDSNAAFLTGFLGTVAQNI